MASHKHGVYSFTVQIARMKAIGGDEYVAEITQLRRHDGTGAAVDLDRRICRNSTVRRRQKPRAIAWR